MAQEKSGSGVVKVPVSASRPTITLPVRLSGEGLFKEEASPGPLTLVSSFFPQKEFDAEFSSFSHLLAGAMSSPSFVSTDRAPEGGGLRFKLGSTLGIASPQSSFVTIPTGVSSTTLLDSPVFRPPTSAAQKFHGPFGISRQQALAHVTAQAVQCQDQLQSASAQPSSENAEASVVNSNPDQKVPSSNTDQISNSPVATDFSPPTEKSPSHKVAADQPLNDGYQWRKYGQKEVKGSKFPRSYYKCKNSICPVKKTVERSVDGQVTEIIYKGQHNHLPTKPIKREKDGGANDGNGSLDMEAEMGADRYAGNLSRGDENLVGQTATKKRHGLTDVQPSFLSEGEEAGDDAETDDGDENEPDPKRRIVDTGVTEATVSHRTCKDSRLIVQTTSEVDLLDDGYRWRKYGQKVVKGNPHPRSYYKCTNAGCAVRKHVERASTDPKAVITTYEGKHNHDVPARKGSRHHTASIQNSSINELQEPANSPKPATLRMLSPVANDWANGTLQSRSILLLKEEQDTAA